MALTTGVGRRAAEPRSVETGQFRTVVLQVLCPQGPCGGRELGQQDSFPRRSPQTSQCNQNYPGFCSYKGKESCCSHLKILLTRKQRYETIGQDSSSCKVLVLPELRRAVFLPSGGGTPASSGPREVMLPGGRALSAFWQEASWGAGPWDACFHVFSLSLWLQPDSPLRFSSNTRMAVMTNKTPSPRR